MAELCDETSETGGEAEDPNPQTRAETQGGRLRIPSRKTGGGKAPHTPAEMSEADPPYEESKRCRAEGTMKARGTAARSPSNGERGLVGRHLRRNVPCIL